MPNSTPLLSIKLRIPPARPASRLVPRPRLVERLDEVWLRPRSVMLISAPPGFGKTTLLAVGFESGSDFRRPD